MGIVFLEHDYLMLTRDGIFTLEDVLPFVVMEDAPYGNPKGKSRPQKLYNDRPVYMDSMRYQTFIMSGIKCVSCELEASFFALERHNGNGDRYHLNLYALNSCGEEVLFTKDHILPRSRGGPTSLHNMQTMCAPCNVQKGNGRPQIKGKRNGEIKRMRRKLQIELDASKEEGKLVYIPGTTDGGLAYVVIRKRRKILIKRMNWLRSKSEHGQVKRRIKYLRVTILRELAKIKMTKKGLYQSGTAYGGPAYLAMKARRELLLRRLKRLSAIKKYKSNGSHRSIDNETKKE